MNSLYYEIIGLYYAGCILIGSIFGFILGILLGTYIFVNHSLLSIILFSGSGFFIGIAFGLFKHASFLEKYSSNDNE